MKDLHYKETTLIMMLLALVDVFAGDWIGFSFGYTCEKVMKRNNLLSLNLKIWPVWLNKVVMGILLEILI